MPKTRKSKNMVDTETTESTLLLEELKKIRQDMTTIQLEQKNLRKIVNDTVNENHNTPNSTLNTNMNANVSSTSPAHEVEYVDPVFQPSATSAPTYKYKASICPLPSFHGGDGLKKFLSNFRDVCRLNGWHLQNEQGLWLKMCLQGKARDVLYDDTNDPGVISNRLQARFGEQLLKKRYELALPRRKRKPSETLADLASDIRNMVNIVYEELDFDTREKMAVKHFIMALESPTAQYELSIRMELTLEGVLDAAQLREVYIGKETPWNNPSPQRSQPTEI